MSLHTFLQVAVWGMLVLLACTGRNVPTGTRIGPESFQYATIFQAPEDKSPGGWRAVCIKAQVSQTVANPQGIDFDMNHECDLEFGSPIVNRQHGHIPLRMAQHISAEVANDVAYTVLSQELGVSAATCLKLKKSMNVAFDIAINGSTVTRCGVTNWSHSVPTIRWP